MTETLGTLVYDIVANDKTKEGTDSSIKNFAKMGAEIGAAGLGVSMVVDGLIEKNKQFEKGVGEISITTGIASDEIRKLTDRFWDATTPLDEVQAGLEELAKTGIKNADEMNTAAEALFTFADASGVSADSIVNDLAPAFSAFNIPLSKLNEHMDDLTYLLQTTPYSFSELSNVLDKSAAPAEAAGLGLNDVLTAIKGLADKGIDGKTAITNIKQAADDAAASTGTAAEKLNTFLTELGLSPEQIQKYTTAMDGAAGSTDKLAKNTQAAAGLSDQLETFFEKITTGAGGSISFLEPVNTALGAISGSVMTLAGGAYILSALGVSAASLGAAAAGAAAFALPLAAIAAALAGIWLVVQHGADINNFLNTTFGQSSGEIPSETFPSTLPQPYVNPTTGDITYPGGSTSTNNTPVGGGTMGGHGHITELAEGGIVTGPTFALVGESGPEAVVPLKNGSAGIGGDIHITIVSQLNGRQVGSGMAIVRRGALGL